MAKESDEYSVDDDFVITCYDHKNQKFKYLSGDESFVMDYIYRRLWANHVKEDIISRIKDIFTFLKYNDSDIEECARRYVFDGDYDCNCTYWSNIDAIIYDHFEKQIGF